MRTTGSAGDPGTPFGTPLAAALVLTPLLQLLPAAGVSALRSQPPPPDAPATVVVPGRVLSSMNRRFLEYNEHWDDASRMNRLTQLLRSGGPTQLEYMGCLQGDVSGDTVRIRDWEEARGMVQLQFGVEGSCDHVPDLLGTWHTHPYRAAADGHPVKTRDLSPNDLESFAEGRNRVILVLWDVDSITVAIRDRRGRVIHPAPAVIR